MTSVNLPFCMDRNPVVIEEVGEGTDRWKVIGQCYLEGAMYGELVDWGEEEGDLFTIV